MVAIFVAGDMPLRKYVKFEDEELISAIVDIFLNGMLKKPVGKVTVNELERCIRDTGTGVLCLQLPVVMVVNGDIYRTVKLWK